MNIGEVADRSGVSARMVRHYEALGMLPSVSRTEGGYRQYGDVEVHVLRFIKRGRELGFSMPEITELLGLWRNRRRSSATVRKLAQEHAEALAARIVAMQEMHATLQHLIHCCTGDGRPDCPILDELSGEGAASRAKRA